ncbi:nime/cyclinb [Flagelloscypha sp. PMI_526]|nr:nime/cyclinb [Flagelloscypha sp. PMI_526]
MASNLPRRVRLVRTENIVPSNDDNVIASKTISKDASRSFGRAKSDSKLAFAGKTSSTLLAPTASSKAKSVAAAPAESGKGEKRKRDALTDKNVLKPKSLGMMNAQAARKTSAAKPVVRKQPVFTRPQSDDDKMQVCEVPAFAAVAAFPPAHVNEHVDEQNDDLDEPAPKRQHTLSPQPPPPQTEDVQSILEADQVARDLHVVAEDDEEADDSQDWEDLDTQDLEDPAMVAEYVVEICEYLKNVEPDVLPPSNYIETQLQLTWSHRQDTLQWTWHLAVNIFDRFLSKRQITTSKLQLVGLVCLFIAAKFEETYVPSVAHMVHGLCPEDLAANKDTLQAFIDKMTPSFMAAERYILQTLGWDLRYPSPLGWLRRGSKADNLDERVRLVGKYLMDVATLEHRLVGISPSLLAASALYLGRFMFLKSEWTPTLAHYTGCKEEDLLDTTKLMIDALLRPRAHYWSTFQKYAHKRYSKIALHCREWAKQRWEANAQVDLEADLSEIKRDIQLNVARIRAKREQKRQLGKPRLLPAAAALEKGETDGAL